MTTALTFGSWLKRRRMGLGLTQKELAHRVGYAAVTLRKVEADELRPSWQMAQKLAEALELGPDEQAQFVRFARDEALWEDIALPAHVTAPEPALPARRASPTTPIQTNLPAPLTTFVGRDHELAELTQAAVTHRLVTLTGAGGIGKTRLAVEAGIRMMWDGGHSVFADGIWLVELAALTSGRMDAELVARSIADSLKLVVPADRTALELLQAWLAPKQLLLTLDNCEHLVQGCAEVAEMLLHHCWQLHILATSREELRIPGELVYPVLPLTLPGPAERSPAQVLAASAVQLFVERMGTAPALRKVQEEDAAAIGHICRRLDGIPLALELAAPLTRSLGLAQIAEQLQDQMAILTNSYRTAIPRHQTMHSALAWSYRLLAPTEQQLLTQVSVFAGGWTFAACQAVSGAALGERLEYALHQLVAKSLVLVEYGNGERRFRLLEPVRQFARAELAAAGDLDAVRQRHAFYYLTQAELLEAARDTPHEREWLHKLEPERDNLRAVNTWALAHNEAEFAHRFNGALFAFWIYCSGPGEARHWLEAALALRTATATPAARRAEAAALDVAGYVVIMQSDYGRAQAYFAREASLQAENGDQRGVAAALRGGSFAAMLDGNLRQAQHWIEQALALSQAVEDRWGIAWGIYDAGYLALVRHDLGQAQALLEKAVSLLREQGIQFGLFRALFALAQVKSECGETTQARELCCQALRLQQQMHYVQQAADCLECLAGIEAREGRAHRAAHLLGTAQAQRESLAIQRIGYRTDWYEHTLTLARDQLDSTAWEAAWDLGRATSLDQAVALALGS